MNEEEKNKKCTCCKNFMKYAVVSLLCLCSVFSSLMLFSINEKVSKISSVIPQGRAKDNRPKIDITRQYAKDLTFEKALATGKPVVVFFYANWCGYCQKFAPIFHKYSKDKDTKENYAIAYVNVEDPVNAEYIKEYEIKGFPSVFLVDGDKRVQIDNSKLFIDAKTLKEEVIKAGNSDDTSDKKSETSVD